MIHALRIWFFVLAVGVAAVHGCEGSPHVSQPPPATQTTAAIKTDPAPIEETAARLDDFRGPHVEVWHLGNELPPKKQLPLAETDLVATGKHSTATIEIGREDRVLLDEESELEIASLVLKQSAQQLKLKAGRLFVDYHSALGKTGFEVSTANAVAAVRGTVFGVSYSPGSSVTRLVTAEKSQVALTSTIETQKTATVQPMSSAVVGDWKTVEITAWGVGLPPDDPRPSDAAQLDTLPREMSQSEYRKKFSQRAARGGVAWMLAERASEIVAKRNLIEFILGVVVNVKTSVRNLVTEQDRVVIRTAGFIKQAQIVERRYYSDGLVETLIGVPGMECVKVVSPMLERKLGITNPLGQVCLTHFTKISRTELAALRKL